MSISEDEFDQRTMQEPQSTMSKAELRKTHKPIMEKRRRARINHCLNEIKSLILEAMNKDPARHSKLEKADILEMAVKHLQNVQRQQLAIAMASDPSVLRKFKSGFNDCATEIDQYIARMNSVDSSLKQNINSHLQKCISGIEQVAHFNFPGFSNAPFISTPGVLNVNRSKIDNSAGDQNNNPKIQIPQGIHLVPSRLPSGELALLLPNSSAVPFISSALANSDANSDIINNNNVRPSAFAAVIPSSTQVQKPLSPPPSPPINNILNEPGNRNVQTLSPQGFRRVQPTVKLKSDYSVEHQDQQVSSTSIPQEKCDQMALKIIRYPIHNPLDKKPMSPRKIVEPLCVITNYSERYKQAQMKDDSAHFEENIQQGVKRKYQEHQGLLTVASNDFQSPATKIMKTSYGSNPSSSWSSGCDTQIRPSVLQTINSKDSSVLTDSNNKLQVAQLDTQGASTSRSSEAPSDMWRPW